MCVVGVLCGCVLSQLICIAAGRGVCVCVVCVCCVCAVCGPIPRISTQDSGPESSGSQSEHSWKVVECLEPFRLNIQLS